MQELIGFDSTLNVRNLFCVLRGLIYYLILV